MQPACALHAKQHGLVRLLVSMLLPTLHKLATEHMHHTPANSVRCCYRRVSLRLLVRRMTAAS